MGVGIDSLLSVIIYALAHAKGRSPKNFSRKTMMRKRSPVDETQRSHSTAYNLRGPVYVKFLLPDKVTGSIIGRQGSVLAELEQTTQAQIKISPSRAFFPLTNERMVMVSGEMDQVTSMIPPVIRKLQENGSDPMRMILRIAVPTSSIPAIIGKGGEIIKSIQARTGGYVHICDRIDGVPETVVEIKGVDRQVDDCTRELIEIIQADPRTKDVTGQYYGSSSAPQREVPPHEMGHRDMPREFPPREMSARDMPPRDMGHHDMHREMGHAPSFDQHRFPRHMGPPPPMMDPTTNPEILMYPVSIEFVVPAISAPYIVGDEGKSLPLYFRDTGSVVSVTEIENTQDVNVVISGPLCGVQAAHLLVIKAVTDAILAQPLSRTPQEPPQESPQSQSFEQ